MASERETAQDWAQAKDLVMARGLEPAKGWAMAQGLERAKDPPSA